MPVAAARRDRICPQDPTCRGAPTLGVGGGSWCAARGPCRELYLPEFPANWCVERRWTKMASAPLLYQGEGSARDILRGFRSATEPEELRMATAAHTITPLPQLSRAVADWVNSVRELTQPRNVYWCEGSEAGELTAQLLRSGELKALNPDFFP